MNDILVLKENGSLVKELQANEQAIIYQSLDTTIDNIDLNLKENASLVLLTFNNGSIKDVNLKSTLARGASLTIYNMIISKSDVSLKEEIFVSDKDASVNILNVCLGYEDAKINSFIHIFHNSEYTNSELETYAIAIDKATLTLDNNATIKKGCRKTVVHQKAKGLNLSKESTIKAQPNLYIDEFDVEASHSASVGNINKDELFYLMSRGLPENEARKIVVLGFINPLIDKIQTVNQEARDIKEGILEEFSQKLK